MNGAPGHEELWAKQRGVDGTYALLAHMLDSGAVASQLFRIWLRPDLQDLIRAELGTSVEQIIAWLVGLHDVGKANPLFQMQPHSRDPQWEPIRQCFRKSNHYEDPQTVWLDRWSKHGDLTRHERVSALEIDGFDILDMSLAEAWKSMPALGHHGFFSVPFAGEHQLTDLKRRASKFMSLRGWSEARRSLNDSLRSAVGLRTQDIPESCSPEVSLLVSGITVLADRLASSTSWTARSQWDQQRGILSLSDPRAWFETQRLRADEYIRQNLGIYEGWLTSAEAEKDILAGRLSRFMQEKVRDAGAGLVSVMAPTGSGKTEAALLRHAQRQERLLFLLPTQATANALMRRVQRAFAATSNVASLAHGLASVEDFYTTPITAFEDSQSQAKGCVEENGGLFPATFVNSGMSRLMASICVATVDQGLKAGLRVKWLHLLLLSLANAHVVIDEVHTLDHYQTKLLETVLQWLGRVRARVTLLTATMPSWQYRQLNAAYYGADNNSVSVFPAVVSDGGKVVKKLPMEPRLIDIDYNEVGHPDTVSEHVQWVNECRERWPHARIGVICNRVAWAQETARKLHDAGHHVIVLHSAMTSAHRQANAQILERDLGPGGRAEGLVVVGTQAIEASLDIDLDILSTDLCPSTSLLQRAGRVWRREDVDRAKRVPGLERTTIRVVDAIDANEGVRFPYRTAELRRTAQWLRQNRGISLPQAGQQFVDTSSVSYIDLLREDADDADYEQYAATVIQKNKAEVATYPVELLLDPSTSMHTLHSQFGSQSSAPAQDHELLRTRDIEEESVRIILGDRSGLVPGAWRGTAAELRSLTGHDREAIRDALAGSINLRRSILEKVSGENLEELSDSKSLIGQFKFMNAGGMYDPLIGFVAAPTNSEVPCGEQDDLL